MSIWAKTLWSGNSPINGEVRIIESFGERRLIAAGYTQSRSLNKEGLTGSYWDGFIRNIPDLKLDDRILILGLAGGTIAKLLTKKFGQIVIDGVEIDPLMVELGKKYLDFNEKNVNIIFADALKYVKDSRYKYDLVGVDLFARGGVAIGAETESFFKNIRNLMSEKGIVVINKLFNGNKDLEDYLKFLEKIFKKTEILLVRGSLSAENVVIYATK